MYMLCAKHGFAQSRDCPAQTLDTWFVQQTMDGPRNPRIARAQTMDRDNPGIVLAQSIDMYMYIYKRWFKRRMILLHQM